MFFIYILYSCSADKYYVGYSADPWKRVQEHNSVKHPTFTSKYRPWTLRAVFKISQNESDALRLERILKRQHSKKLLERLIDPSFIPDGQLVELLRFPHLRD
ncbi:MAG: GIY-YIG nuclease family protein [Flavisolibacter sp.]